MDGSLDLKQDRPEAAHGQPAQDPDRSLWAALAEAATAESFCRSWLALQCRMLPGVTAGLVLLGPPDGGPYRPVAVWPDSRRNLSHLTLAAERALTERRGLVRKPESETTGGQSGLDRYEIAYPIEVRERLHGVVVLEVTARPKPQLQTALRHLHWGGAGLEVLVSREELHKETAARERLQAVLDLLATAAGHERFQGAAMGFVSALATRLQCDRVSLGFLRRGRTRIHAVSHSAQFKERSNLLRAVAEAMDEAIDQSAAVTLPPLTTAPPVVIRAHEELARHHGIGAICTVPLSMAGRPAGALTFERPADRRFDLPTVELCEAVAALAGPLLDLHRREDRWLITKAASSARTILVQLLGPRHVPLKLATLALMGIVAFLVFAKDEYRVSAKSVLEPMVQQAAVAPFDGFMREAPLRAGDLVRRGTVLATLDDRDLRLERLKWLSQQEELTRQYRQAMAERDAAKVEILSAQIDQAKAQVALLDEQLQRTVVLAPFDGVIASGDLSQSLGAPVEKGKVLFEVAPLKSFRLVLEVDERDVADLKAGQRGLLVLTAFPDDSHPFAVEKVTPVSTAKEGRNYFRVEGTLDHEIPRLRPGMEGVGKVVVDRRLIVWIWTHQIIDAIRLALWKWLP